MKSSTHIKMLSEIEYSLILFITESSSPKIQKLSLQRTSPLSGPSYPARYVLDPVCLYYAETLHTVPQTLIS